jgi:hypothetical protein
MVLPIAAAIGQQTAPQSPPATAKVPFLPGLGEFMLAT